MYTFTCAYQCSLTPIDKTLYIQYCYFHRVISQAMKGFEKKAKISIEAKLIV